MAQIISPESFSRYETARILGARALQISMNAPVLIKLGNEELERIKFDPLMIAEKEFTSGILPISVNKPFPEKKESQLKKSTDRQIRDAKKRSLEAEEEKEIEAEGEIMELATPDDEVEDSGEEKNSELE